MGTAAFAVPILQALIATEDYCPFLLITQPDVKVGRKQVWQMPLTKELALAQGIKVLQPTTLKDGETAKYLRDEAVDLIITAAYGKILPTDMLTAPKYGAINIHGSLLPKYRGASPIQNTLLNGEQTAGISIIDMVEEMDAGAIYAKYELAIDNTINYGELETALANLAANKIVDFLDAYFAGKLTKTEQDPAQVSKCKLLTRTDGAINWSKTANEIHNQIRAFNPWPNTFTNYNDKRVKIYASKLCDLQQIDLPEAPAASLLSNYEKILTEVQATALAAGTEAQTAIAGTVLFNKQGRLFVACRDGILEITDLQFANSKHCALKDIAHNISIFSKFATPEEV